MTNSSILNIVGLTLDIIGVLMLFKYGLPPELNRDGAIFLVCEENDEEQIRKAKRYDKYSYSALTLLVIGFLLQLLANII